MVQTPLPDCTPSWMCAYRALLGVLAAGLSYAAGCGPETEGCDPIGGIYVPDYQFLAPARPALPACEANFQRFHVDIPEGDSATRMSSTPAAGTYVISTNVSVSGCDLTFEQTQFFAQERQWLLAADLVVISSDELSGVVERVEYDAAGNPVCGSTLGATLLRQGSTP